MPQCGHMGLNCGCRGPGRAAPLAPGQDGTIRRANSTPALRQSRPQLGAQTPTQNSVFTFSPCTGAFDNKLSLVHITVTHWMNVLTFNLINVFKDKLRKLSHSFISFHLFFSFAKACHTFQLKCFRSSSPL